MDLDQLDQLLKLVRAHDFSEFEIEQDGLRLKVRKDGGAGASSLASGQGATGPVVPIGQPAAVPAPAAAGAPLLASGGEDIELAVVKSPIVGTFYRAPEPGAPPFVDIGSIIKKGQVLCVIEAMKLMNEIDAECDGEVMNVYVENGQPVQYGERLFAIKTK